MLATEKKFVHEALGYFAVKAFLGKELDKAGVSKITIQKTPIATRVTIEVRRPGMVVGKKGAGITETSDLLKQKFGIENPQIEMIEVPVPSLDAVLMSEKIARQVELKGNIKQIMRMALREIMSAGAIGAEIRVAGKVVGKGGKAKTLKVRQGYLKKSGDMMKIVRLGKRTAYPKAGAIGVTVKILPPGVQLNDKIDLTKLLQFEKPIAVVPQQATAEGKAVEAKSVEVKIKEEPAQPVPA